MKREQTYIDSTLVLDSVINRIMAEGVKYEILCAKIDYIKEKTGIVIDRKKDIYDILDEVNNFDIDWSDLVLPENNQYIFSFDNKSIEGLYDNVEKIILLQNSTVLIKGNTVEFLDVPKEWLK